MNQKGLASIRTPIVGLDKATIESIMGTQAILASLNTQLLPVIEKIRKSFEPFRKYPTGPLKLPSWEDQERMFEQSLVNLARNGWFISLWRTPVAVVHSASNAFFDAEAVAADTFLCQHFKTHEDEIIADAITEFPTRRTILEKALAAHKRGDYELSIPAFLAQSDGIGEETFKVSPFTCSPKALEALKHFVETQMDKDFCSIYWKLIYVFLDNAQQMRLPIKSNTAKLGAFRKPLNRHEIMHGLNVVYATELNAFKTLSWIQYIVSFKTDLRWSKEA